MSEHSDTETHTNAIGYDKDGAIPELRENETIHIPCVVCEDLFLEGTELYCKDECGNSLHHTEGWWYCSEECKQHMHMQPGEEN